MTKLEKVYPKDTFGLMLIYAVSMMAIVFGLSWKEIILLFVLDTAVFFLYQKFDIFIFYRLFPQFSEFRDMEKAVAACDYSFDRQQNFFEKISRYPEVRFFELLFSSLVKVLPAAIFVGYVSKATPSFKENVFLFYVADIFIIFYTMSLTYVQLHVETSAVMGSLKKRAGWVENYRELRITHLKDKHIFIQNFLLIAMLGNLLWIIEYTSHLESLNSNYYIFILFASAVICMGRVLFLFQNFLRSSLKTVADRFNKDFAKEKMDPLPLHTSPFLSQFEFAFNQLGRKLDERENEISQWLKYESSQFHFKALGEITAMVAHDMKTPLHVMSMSLEMMNSENLSPENRKKYQEILERNLHQSISFSQTLMAYVRGDKEEGSCAFGEIHHYLLDLFKTQFNEADLARIEFKVSEEVWKIELKISRIDAMHIFYNLYQNAIKTVLAHDKPSIAIDCQIQNHYVMIFLHNSGPSLSPDMFYNLISFDRFNGDKQFYNGLGLRLTNSILTHLKGSLDIVHVENGTCLKISLPHEADRQLNLDIDPDNSEDSLQ